MIDIETKPVHQPTTNPAPAPAELDEWSIYDPYFPKTRKDASDAGGPNIPYDPFFSPRKAQT